MTAASLRRALKLLGLANRAAAAQLGISYRVLSYYLAGARPVPAHIAGRVSNWIQLRAAEDRAVERAMRQLHQATEAADRSIR